MWWGSRSSGRRGRRDSAVVARRVSTALVILSRNEGGERNREMRV
jgi:hypothetical protein